MGNTRISHSFCRMCIAYCPILVTVVDGRPVKVTGNPDVPEFGGYTCPKGRALPEYHNDPNRLLTSLRRGEGGAFEPISSDDAVREVAERLKAVIDRHGPKSVALYLGIGGLQQSPVMHMAISFV